MQKYKVIYNRKRKWYPGTNVFKYTFNTRAEAQRAKARVMAGKRYVDQDIKHSEIISYTVKPRRK